MLKSLVLNNFKKHNHLEIVFSPKLTLLQGKNYQGKSSVLHGILYALGGSRQVPGGAAIIRNKISKKKETVTLEFTVGSDNYKIIRSGNNATLSKNGEAQATGTSPVNSEVAKILGMPIKLFTLTHYSPQGEAKMLVEMGAPALNRLLEEACEVDLIDLVLGSLKDRQTKLEAQLEVMEVENLQDLSEKEESERIALGVMHTDLETKKDCKAELELRLTDRKDSLEGVQTKNGEIGRNNHARELAEQNKETHLSSFKSLEAEELELPDHIPSTETAEELTTNEVKIKSMEDRQREAKTAKDRKEKLNQQLLSVEEEEANAIAALADVPEPLDVEYLMGVSDNAFEELTKAEERKILAEILLKEGVCPTCHRPHEYFNEEQAKKEFDKSVTEVEDWTVVKEVARKTLNKEILIQSDRGKAERNLESVSASKDKKAAELEAIPFIDPVDTEQLHMLRLKVEGLKAAHLEALQMEAKRTTLREQMVKAANELAKCEEALTALPDLEEETDVKPYEEEVTLVRNALQEATTAAQNLALRYSASYCEWERSKETLTQAREAEDKRKKTAKALATGTNLTKFLRENRSKFMENLWGSITGMASSMLQACTNGAVSSVRRGSDGEFTYLEGELEMPIAAASGAQKALIGTALKQAIRAAMPAGIPLALLDEVTADMDADHAFAVSSQLAASGEQIIAVSHREGDGYAADCQVVL